MTTFVYKAKKSSAETVMGQISADSQDEAIDLINQLGLLPVSVEPKAEERIALQKARPQKIKIQELYIFSRQLANLLKSGMTLLRSLGVLEAQMPQPYLKKVIAQVALNVKNGHSLSESLADYPRIFSPLYITMVNAGEESGNLYDMLVYIANYQKKQAEVSSKIKMALAYPSLMITVGFATVYFLLTFVLPKMNGLFQNMGNKLPWPTVVLLNTGAVLKSSGIWIFLIILGLFFALEKMGQIQKGRLFLSRVVLRLPLLGEIVLRAEFARFCRTLVMLSKGGVSVLRAIEIAIPILSNEVIKQHLQECKDDLVSGGSFGQSLKKFKEIPSMMGDLIAVGEESGHLDDVLGEIASTYEQETDEQIKLMTTLFEPIMILVVGLMIGFIVFSMLLPIFSIDVLAV